MVAPCMPLATKLPGAPPITFGASAVGAISQARTPLTRKTSGLLSVVPTKSVVGLVPALPVKFQALLEPLPPPVVQTRLVPLYASTCPALGEPPGVLNCEAVMESG